MPAIRQFASLAGFSRCQLKTLQITYCISEILLFLIDPVDNYYLVFAGKWFYTGDLAAASITSSS